jgi:hypothetical protein
MADDINVTPGSGATVATDEISSKHYQRVKLIEGADGVNDGDISAANPLPVEDTALLALLLRLLNILRMPAGYDATLNRLRITALLESGSTTAVTGSLTSAGTVSTVTTVTNLTNVGSYGGTQLVDYDGRSAWALTNRARIT